MKKSFLYSLVYIISLRSALLPIAACMLPAISDSLSIPRNKIQFTLTAFYAGMMLAKLIATLGITNKMGNRKTLLITIPAAAAGLLICFLPDFTALITGCIFQGLGVGMIRSISADLARMQKSTSYAKTWTRLTQIALWMPVVVTLACGWTLEYIAWQFNLVIGLILVILGWFFIYCFVPVSDGNIPIKAKEKFKRMDVIKQLAISPVFVCYTVVISLLVSISAVFYTTTPFIFIKDMGFSAKYYFIFVLIVISGAFIGLRLNNILEKYIEHKTIILLSCCLAAFVSILLLIVDLANYINVYNIMFAFFCAGIAMTMAESSVRTYISKEFTKYVVMATAFCSCILSSATAACSASAAYLIKEDLENISFIFCAISIPALIAALIPWFKKSIKNN